MTTHRLSARRPRLLPLFPLAALAVACTPTVKVEAPDKPIEINLNIRIEQEVRLKIDRELDQVFKDNPELFGVPAAPADGASKEKKQ